MDFAHSPRAQDLRQRLEAFMQRYLLPYNAAWHRSVQDGVYPPPFLEDLKALARTGSTAAYFTTPEQLQAPPRIR